MFLGFYFWRWVGVTCVVSETCGVWFFLGLVSEVGVLWSICDYFLGFVVGSDIWVCLGVDMI